MSSKPSSLSNESISFFTIWSPPFCSSFSPFLGKEFWCPLECMPLFASPLPSSSFAGNGKLRIWDQRGIWKIQNCFCYVCYSPIQQGQKERGEKHELMRFIHYSNILSNVILKPQQAHTNAYLLLHY